MIAPILYFHYILAVGSFSIKRENAFLQHTRNTCIEKLYMRPRVVVLAFRLD